MTDTEAEAVPGEHGLSDMEREWLKRNAAYSVAVGRNVCTISVEMAERLARRSPEERSETERLREAVEAIKARAQEERVAAERYPLGDVRCANHGGRRDGLTEAGRLIVAALRPTEPEPQGDASEATKPRQPTEPAYAILNPWGDFWTPLTFASKEGAQRHLEQFWAGLRTAPDFSCFSFPLVDVSLSVRQEGGDG